MKSAVSTVPLLSALTNFHRARRILKPRLQFGYSFGARYVVRHLRPDRAKIDVGYCAHPNLVEKNELQEIKD
jgi:hypothetical protein